MPIAFRRGDRASSDAGQSLLELALALPLMLVVLLGTFDIVRLLAAAMVLQTAVQAGAQFGALSAANSVDGPAIESVVRNEAQLPQSGPSNPAVSSATSVDAAGERLVSVQATFTHATMFRYPGLPSLFSITRSSVVQVRR